MIDDDRPNPLEEAQERRWWLYNRRYDWIPERLTGESEASYKRRYAAAEFKALVDGKLVGPRTTYTDGFGDQQWSDPAGGRFS